MSAQVPSEFFIKVTRKIAAPRLSRVSVALSEDFGPSGVIECVRFVDRFDRLRVGSLAGDFRVQA